MGIYLVLQEKVCFGHSLTSQVMEESVAPDVFADQVNQAHAQQKYHGYDSGIFERQGGLNFHGFSSVRINPIPGLV